MNGTWSVVESIGHGLLSRGEKMYSTLAGLLAALSSRARDLGVSGVVYLVFITSVWLAMLRIVVYLGREAFDILMARDSWWMNEYALRFVGVIDRDRVKRRSQRLARDSKTHQE